MSISNNVNYYSLEESNNRYWVDRGYVPQEFKEKVAAYLLPYDHPARQQLDVIYSKVITSNPATSMFGSQVNIVQHPELMELGLIVKEPKTYSTKKYSGLLRRVEAHKVARLVIEGKNITHVKVPQNWLYPLPVEADIGSSLAYHIGKPIYTAFKALSIKPPQWLKYGDSIQTNRFIVVEEYVKIQFPKSSVRKSVSDEVIEEWKEVFETVGFKDASDMNYSLEKDGTITLFDLEDYSHKSEKNQLNGRIGINLLFPNRFSVEQMLL